MKPTDIRLLAALLIMPAGLQAADVNVTADITTNTTWVKSNTYIISKSIFVKSGATLTIEPGTTVLGTRGAGVDGLPDTADDTYGSLIITRAGMIDAAGTAAEPIVFTAVEERDGFDDDDDPMTPNIYPVAGEDASFWGGVIILGEAPINFYVSGTNANENEIEGFPAGSSTDIRYGGSNAADNSGMLTYASIRFGGYQYATDKEINGLTLGGVGSGTTIHHVEIVGNSDDGIEFFGGTVNTKRIAVAFCQDDGFDMDEAHSGYHQFWFAIQADDPVLGNRGGEWDGGNGSTKSGSPYTLAQVFNATFIGDGAVAAGEAAGAQNSGLYLDDYFAGQLHNSVLHDFSGQAMEKASDGVSTAATPGVPKCVFSNNTWGSFQLGAGLLANVGAGTSGNPDGTGNSAVGTNPQLAGISRTNDGGLDPRPLPASSVWSATRSAFPAGAPAGFFETAGYRGAFGDSNWLDGWSYLSQHGYLGDLGGGSGADPYENWADDTFPGGFGAPNTGAGDDYDGDGVINGDEFAFGLDATSVASVSPIQGGLAADGVFSFTRLAASGLTYRVKYSTNLSNWFTDGGAIQTPGAVNGEGVQSVVVQLSAGLLGNTTLFVRIEAQ